VIEVRSTEEWNRPVPVADPATEAYWSGLLEGRLLIERCVACGHRQFYPRGICTDCGADPEWEEASGRGTVHTFTIIRQNGARPFRDELPYVVAVVHLEEGPMMMGNVTGCPVEDVTIGMAVQAYAVKAADGVGVPFWEPAG
jgi:uncharacterized OB-fold protein